MSITYQSNIYTTVTRSAPGEMLAQSTLLSTGYEAVARIKAATADYMIKEARWDVYRSPEGRQNGGRDVAALQGVEAYFQAGAALRAVGKTEGDLPRDMLAESVRGIIQAETYLVEDRGFPSTEDYEAFWKENFGNSCRLYSNPALISQTWYEYIADRKWGDVLFNRSKTAIVRQQEGTTLYASGGFSDSFHELGVKLTLQEGLVTLCSGEFLRAPDPICRENMTHLAQLKGKAVTSLTKQEIGMVAGGSQGCHHLVDLLSHVARSLQEAQQTVLSKK